AGEPPLRSRCGEVVADGTLVGEELLRHHRADSVQAGVVRADGAGAVAVVAGHRLGPARLQLAAEDVAFAHVQSMPDGGAATPCHTPAPGAWWSVTEEVQHAGECG